MVIADGWVAVRVYWHTSKIGIHVEFGSFAMQTLFSSHSFF